VPIALCSVDTGDDVIVSHEVNKVIIAGEIGTELIQHLGLLLSGELGQREDGYRVIGAAHFQYLIPIS
jgi:hypothetical protein